MTNSGLFLLSRSLSFVIENLNKPTNKEHQLKDLIG
jgi:hypothetical protein